MWGLGLGRFGSMSIGGFNDSQVLPGHGSPNKVAIGSETTSILIPIRVLLLFPPDATLDLLSLLLRYYGYYRVPLDRDAPSLSGNEKKLRATSVFWPRMPMAAKLRI